jgi:signal transduction histidine kinase
VQSLGLGGLTIKAVLALGFGMALAVWVFTGYYFTQRINEVEREADAIGQRYMRAQEALSNVGSQVLLSSVYLRDALLDPDERTVEYQRRRIDDVYDALDRQLDVYVPVRDSQDERAHVERLRKEIQSFRATANEILGSDAHKSPAGARLALNAEVVPKRESVIRVSEEIRALNRAALLQQQAIISDIHRAAERRSWQWLTAALAISVGIGLLAITYSSRLEARLRQQQTVEARHNRELQLLSAKLIRAQEEERQTIARELHDEVGQVLTAIKVELAVAQRRLNASGAAGELLEEAQGIADTALHSVRDISHLLHPALLDDVGLAAAVDWYLQAFSKRHNIKTELVQDGEWAQLAPHVELAAYRIVQEALTNVARHADARSCRVTLRHEGDTLSVMVEDDGKGFDVSMSGPDASGRRGLGLLSMRERAIQLKGHIRIDSAVGGGTRVVAELPAEPRSEHTLHA